MKAILSLLSLLLAEHSLAMVRCSVLFFVVSSACLAAPANDPFSAAAVISGQPGSISGTSVGATREISEPFHGGYGGTGSVWYRWTAPASGPYQFAANGSYHLLAIYTGTQLGSLAPIASQIGYFNPAAKFTASQGTVYSIALDSAYAGGGEFSLSWSVVPPAPANDNFAAAQSISGLAGSVEGSLVSATTEPSEPNHNGFDRLRSVWYRWTAPVTGSIEFSVSSDSYFFVAVYSGTQINNLTPLASQIGNYSPPAKFAVVAGTEYRIAVDSPSWGGTQFSLDWTSPPPNDNFAAAEAITPMASATVTGTLRSASSEGINGEPDLSDSDFWENDLTVWYSWTAPVNATWLQVRVSGINLRNQLAVYTGEALDSLTQVRLNERGILAPNRSTFPVVPGETYRIRLAAGAYAKYEVPFPVVADYDFNLELQSIQAPASAANLILRGRGLMEEKTPAAMILAKTDFAAALAMSPANQEAGFLLALAQLLALEGETGFTTLLNNLGIPVTGSLRGSGYDLPTAPDGFPVFASGADSSLAVTWLKDHVLPRLIHVRTALSSVSSNSFKTDLTSSEAGMPEGDTLMDRGDALALVAGTRALEMLVHLVCTYNLSTVLNDLVDLDRQGQLDAQRVLQTYQSLLAFSTTDRRTELANALRSLNGDFIDAADVIHQLRSTEPLDSLGPASTRLDQETENSLRADLAASVESLDQEVLIRGDRVNLSRFLVTSDPLRTWVPVMRESEVFGNFPDPTFDGILPGNTDSVSENRLYELGRLWGMGQYAVEIGDYLKLLGLASAPGEDADGDGKSNFGEWIFGSDPASGEVVYQSELRQTLNHEGQSEIRFSFIRSIHLEEWKLVVAVSDDLKHWDDSEATVEPVGLPVPTGDGFSEIATYRLVDSAVLPAKKYFRAESRPKP